jgi:DNA-binding NarL/FixJ family response regulator
MGPVTPPRRVVIVDDDLWMRTGRAHALETVEGIQVQAALTHTEALQRTDVWATADVVLVDAWDDRAGFDRFPGVGVVEAIRAQRGPDQTTIIVITGHVVNDMLRLRMAEAGADYFYGHDAVSDVDDLVAAITALDEHARPHLNAEQLAQLGIRHDSRPNATLDWIQAHHYETAFSGESQKSLPVTRRAIMRIRREIGETAKLDTSTPSGSPHPARWPEWHHVVRFVNRLRGADRDNC